MATNTKSDSKTSDWEAEAAQFEVDLQKAIVSERDWCNAVEGLRTRLGGVETRLLALRRRFALAEPARKIQ